MISDYFMCISEDLKRSQAVSYEPERSLERTALRSLISKAASMIISDSLLFQLKLHINYNFT